MGEARNVKFGILIDLGKSHLMHNKLPQKRRDSRGRIFKFWDPLSKYGKGEARNFKFGIRIDLGKSHLTVEKYPNRGRGKGP